MKKMTLSYFLAPVFIICCYGLCFGYDDSYPHRTWCPNVGNYMSGDFYSNTAGCWVDGSNSFCQCNCTAYAAWKIQPYVYDFKNSYLGKSWSHGSKWDDAARSIGISVDSFPIPFDIAYSDSGTYGHVAFVEKVYYDSNGNATHVDVTEYNYPGGYVFNQRLNVSISKFSGFIHIAAYREGVDAMTYLDSLEMCSLDTTQTKEEWEIINKKVWSNYRCINCSGNYSIAYINNIANAVGGYGGGPGSETVATEAETPGLPDFIVKKVSLISSTTQAETYTYGRNDSIIIDSYSKNIGQANWAGSSDSMEVRFYLSKGYKEDAHSEWRKIGVETIKKGNINVGITKRETHTFDLATGSTGGGHLGVGIYNFVVCVDRNKDQDNQDGDVPEMHKSNNCSTEAIFEVKDGAVCINPPVKVAGNTYDTIQDAYNAAATGSTVQIQNQLFTENVLLNRDITTIFDSGYDCNYTTNTGYSTVDGTMTIRKGTVTVKNIIIK